MCKLCYLLKSMHIYKKWNFVRLWNFYEMKQNSLVYWLDCNIVVLKLIFIQWFTCILTICKESTKVWMYSLFSLNRIESKCGWMVIDNAKPTFIKLVSNRNFFMNTKNMLFMKCLWVNSNTINIHVINNMSYLRHAKTNIVL